MKTSVMEVQDMLSVLSVQGVEERIGKVPGVESVTVNYAAGSATVRYDETRLDLHDIRSDVRQSGFKTDAVSAPSAEGHEGHVPPGAAPAATTAPKPPAVASSAAGAARQDKASPSTTPNPAPGAPAPAPTSAGPKSAPNAAPPGDEKNPNRCRKKVRPTIWFARKNLAL